MIAEKSVIGLILARGGSKGLPGKNTRPLLGKPLVAWSIEQGRASTYIDSVVVSTDDQGIAAVATQFGAEVPFIRPHTLASDTATSVDSILHALDFLEDAGRRYDIVVLLEPTSPLRESKDIDLALEKLIAHEEAQSIVGVAQVGSAHPAFLVQVKDGLARPFNDTIIRALRRQDTEEVFFLEGSVYASYTRALRDRRTFYHDKTLPYLVPKYKSFEIDDLTDFFIVEALMTAHQNGAINE